MVLGAKASCLISCVTGVQDRMISIGRHDNNGSSFQFEKDIYFGQACLLLSLWLLSWSRWRVHLGLFLLVTRVVVFFLSNRSSLLNSGLLSFVQDNDTPLKNWL